MSISIQIMLFRVIIVSLAIAFVASSGCSHKVKSNNDLDKNFSVVESIVEAIPQKQKWSSDMTLDQWIKNYYRLRFYFKETAYPRFNTILEVTANPHNRAVVEYSYFVNADDYGRWKLEIDGDEWKSFLRSLYKSGIREWSKDGYKNMDGFNEWNWSVGILYEDDTLVTSFGVNQFPPDNWIKFDEIIKDFLSAMVYKRENKHNAEYKKNFGMSMSEFERFVERIHFYNGSYHINTDYFIFKDVVSTEYNSNAYFYAKLEIGDWLNIVRALGNIARECGKINLRLKPEIENFERLFSKKMNNTANIVYPPSWSEFNKTMADIVAKIKKKAGVEAFETELENMYRKKYGTEISEFERSLTSIRLADTTEYIEIRRSVRRPADEFEGSYRNIGIFMINNKKCTNCFPDDPQFYCYCNSEPMIKELDIEIWLELIRALHDINFNEWEMFNAEKDKRSHINVAFTGINQPSGINQWISFCGCDIYLFENSSSNENEKKTNWSVSIDFFDNGPLEYSGYGTYPPNWEKINKLMLNLEKWFMWRRPVYDYKTSDNDEW